MNLQAESIFFSGYLLGTVKHRRPDGHGNHTLFHVLCLRAGYSQWVAVQNDML